MTTLLRTKYLTNSVHLKVNMRESPENCKHFMAIIDYFPSIKMVIFLFKKVPFSHTVLTWWFFIVLSLTLFENLRKTLDSFAQQYRSTDFI